MKIIERIFKGEKYYITSPFGYRTRNGKKELHTGCDYGTHLKKLKQYAVEEGKVTLVGYNSVAGNYIEITYPRINKISRHIHLDKILVKKNEEVDNDKVVAITGTTGSSTGIHLHLGLKSADKKLYEDPEVYNYQPLAIAKGSDRDLTKDQVLIKGNNLRIRKEPNTTSDIVGFVENEKYYDLLGSKDGWNLIEEGWISGNYCELYNKKNDEIEQIQELQIELKKKENKIEQLLAENKYLDAERNALEQQMAIDKVNVLKEFKIAKNARYIITLDEGNILKVMKE